MSSPSVYTALSIPSVAPSPSINTLQWSDDGQAIIVTTTAIHVLTPDLGINFDTASAIKAAPLDEDSTETSSQPISWFRTLVEFDKVSSHHWPADSHDWSAMSLGSLDPIWRGVTCSPGGLTTNAGCLLVALSSNLELSLWSPVKNHLKGEWTKVQDITAYLKQHLQTTTSSPEEDVPLTLEAVLQVQVNCTAWSRQTDFGISPIPRIDGSFLASGNRAGCVIFMRLGSTAEGAKTLSHVSTVHVADSWVVHVAWTSWFLEETHICTAYLACAISDGSVIIVKVQTRYMSSQRSNSLSDVPCELETTFEVQPEKAFEGDHRGITALSWIDISGSVNPILVHCKPGTIHLWSSWPNLATDSRTSVGWTGERTVLLQTQKLSVGSSALTPPSGITYIRKYDALLLALFDGSFHVLFNLTIEPTYLPPTVLDATDMPPTPQSMTTKDLSAMSRAVFVEVETSMRQSKPRKSDMNCITGMMSYDGVSTLAWMHEVTRPTDFSYKSDSKLSSSLIVTSMWPVDTVQIFDEIERILNHSSSASCVAPIALLRPVFLQLRSGGMLEALHSKFQIILRPPPPPPPPLGDNSHSINIPLPDGEVTLLTRAAYRRNIGEQLFGRDTLLSLRLRLAVADYCWKLSDNKPDRQAEYGDIAQLLQNTLSRYILGIFVQHLAAVVTALTEADIGFVMRIILQSQLPDNPPNLSSEADKLFDVLTARGILGPSSSTGSVFGLDEPCPACNAPIPLQDITSAVCGNGHVWTRCSITFFILSTPMVRTCIGCTRKAFLPISQNTAASTDGGTLSWLPAVARCWIVEELLEACQSCVFCGNRFARVL